MAFNMEKQQEKQLIEQAKKDPQAFAEIYEEYYGPIFGYILKRVGNVTVAQDITSETFFKALDRLWQFKWKNVSISSWLYRIATNEMNQHFRKNKKIHASIEELLEKSGIELEDEHDLREEVIAQEEELARSDQWREAQKAISKLSEKYQEVLSLRYFEDKKIKEISEILGKREGTVKSLLSRGTKKLRSIMSETQPNLKSGIIDTQDAISPASKINQTHE